MRRSHVCPPAACPPPTGCSCWLPGHPGWAEGCQRAAQSPPATARCVLQVWKGQGAASRMHAQRHRHAAQHAVQPTALRLQQLPNCTHTCQHSWQPPACHPPAESGRELYWSNLLRYATFSSVRVLRYFMRTGPSTAAPAAAATPAAAAPPALLGPGSPAAAPLSRSLQANTGRGR